MDQTLRKITSGAHVLTPEDLGAFLDGIMPLQLHREDIAGAVVLVVEDGHVIFERGYGYADVAKRIPVTPRGTLFRAGSVSKLFTWTAVMQLVQQGKIDLDQNVNTYLDFKIPDTFPHPITMRNLMTHTAGFEDTLKDLVTANNSPPAPLRDYLVHHMPERVYPPGTKPAYSNYGATLAGYIVQRLSGVPFDDYVQKNIFQPLDMSHTSFRQPLPPALQLMMSDGYALGSGDPKAFEMVGVPPAGASSTSAEDISHFMLAHLNGGEYNGARILEPATVRLMHSAQFAEDPTLAHMCLGFYEETRNGHRIIGHGGDTQFFHSDLHLIPDENLGFFVSFNSSGRGEADPRTVLFHAFLDRYFPYNLPAMQVQPNAARDAQTVAGEYITSRRPVTNILSLFGMLGNTKVSARQDGSIVIDGFKDLAQVPKTWIEIDPLLYRQKDGQDLVGFTRDSHNRLVLSTDDPTAVWTEASFDDTKAWNYFLLIVILLVSVATFLFWPLSAWIRRHYRHPLQLSNTEGKLRAVIRIVAGFDLLFVACWVSLLAASGGEPLFDTHLDPVLRLVQVIGWLGSLGTFAILYGVVTTWKSPGEWWASHVGNIAAAMAAIAFSWFLFHWHLLHLSLNF
jgi:CubicO group peptidase (beta-lactamase class C family)